MGDVRRVFAVDLVGTQLLLDAFEPLVEPGSAAVCFTSSSAYQVSMMGPDPELDTFVEDPALTGSSTAPPRASTTAASHTAGPSAA